MDVLEGVEAGTTYAKSLCTHSLPPFIISESNLGMGASLGNSSIWIHTKGTGAIERVFLNDVGESLLGTVSLRYGARARPLVGGVPASTTEHQDVEYSSLYPETGSRTFEIHPAYQCVRFKLASVLDIEETTF